MADSFPVDEAQIVALFMECIAYGVYLVTLGMTIRALFWGSTGTKERYNWTLIVVVALMFIFASFDVAFGLRHNLDAFIFYKGPGGAIAEFEDISYWVNVMKTVDVEVMALIGDAMLIYRCLVVFSWKWWIIAFPALLWLGNLACCIVILYITITLKRNTLLSLNNLLDPFLTAFLVITLVTNLITTGLIVWRIWLVSRFSSQLTSISGRRNGRSRLANIMRIVVESGLLYTSFVLITFGTELAGSNALYGVSDVMVIVVGISFNLIIIRVDQGVAYGDTFVETTMPTSIPLSFRSGGTRQPGTPSSVAVMVSRDVDYHVTSTFGKDATSIASADVDGSRRKDDWAAV